MPLSAGLVAVAGGFAAGSDVEPAGAVPFCIGCADGAWLLFVCPIARPVERANAAPQSAKPLINMLKSPIVLRVARAHAVCGTHPLTIKGTFGRTGQFRIS